ncbi:MAG: MFS transporter [Patescibacteria group bacterium]
MIALLLDVPVGVLQRYFIPKKLYLFGVFAQLIAGLIFLKFIYASSLFTPAAGSGITTVLGQFLDSFSNIFLLFAAAGMYGFTKEINDITTISYILNNADPSEYSSIMSRNNIFGGIGSLLGLLVSGFVLALNPTAAVIILNVFIVILIAFIFSYFDSSTRTITLADIQKLKVIAKRENLEKIKEYAIGYVAKTDFAALAQEVKLIFIRPASIKDEKFSIQMLIPETKKELFSIKKTIAELPFNIGLLWFVSLILIFGFWDTFAAGFLIEYFAKLPTGQEFAYIFLGMVAIPAFVMQDPMIKLSKRIGVFPVALFGVIISGVSLLLLSIVDSTAMIVIAGMCNSVGFAAGMGISQGGFLDLYNSEFAKKEGLVEIDSNASASPMKIVQNLANVAGMMLGGTLLAVFGFQGFFAVFGLAILAFAGFSFVKKSMIAF